MRTLQTDVNRGGSSNFPDRVSKSYIYLPIFLLVSPLRAQYTAYINKRARTNTQIHARTHKYTHEHTNTRTNTQIHARTHKYTHEHTNTRAHAHTYRHTHTHTLLRPIPHQCIMTTFYSMQMNLLS